jgi:hypothetical protein
METLFLMSLIWTSRSNGLAPWTWFLVIVSQTAAAKKLGSWIGRLCLLSQECLKWMNFQRGLTTLGQSHAMANPMIRRVLNPPRITKQETISQGCSTYVNRVKGIPGGPATQTRRFLGYLMMKAPFQTRWCPIGSSQLKIPRGLLNINRFVALSRDNLLIFFVFDYFLSSTFKR